MLMIALHPWVFLQLLGETAFPPRTYRIRGAMQIINAYFIRGPPSLCPPWGSQGPAKSKLGSGGEGDSEDLNSLAPLARFTQVSETPWALVLLL